MPKPPRKPITGPRVHVDHAEPAARSVEKAPVAPRPGAEEDPEHAKERQQAFDAEFSWRGVKLLPFTSSREGLFSQHRVSMGAPDLQRCLSDLDGFFLDACRILWLCSHTPEDWAILRCSPVELQCAIDRWADEHITTQESSAATLTAFKIYAAARTNEHAPAPLPGKAHGDDLGN